MKERVEREREWAPEGEGPDGGGEAGRGGGVEGEGEGAATGADDYRKGDGRVRGLRAMRAKHRWEKRENGRSSTGSVALHHPREASTSTGAFN